MADSNTDEAPTSVVRFELSYEPRDHDPDGEWGHVYEGEDLTFGRWLTRDDLEAIIQACERALDQRDDE